MGGTHAGVIFGPVAVASTYGETIDRLGTAIRIGLLAPGTRLPPERDLADRLGISRSTLRQALGALIETGHLVAIRGRAGGTFVADTPPLTSPDPLPAHRVRDLLDWRLTLELSAAELAADRADVLALEALADAAEHFARLGGSDDVVLFRRTDIAFHLRLAEAAGSERIMSEMTTVHGHLNDLCPEDVPARETALQLADDHLRVVRTIHQGDADGARAAMRIHCRRSEEISWASQKPAA